MANKKLLFHNMPVYLPVFMVDIGYKNISRNGRMRSDNKLIPTARYMKILADRNIFTDPDRSASMSFDSQSGVDPRSSADCDILQSFG